MSDVELIRERLVKHLNRCEYAEDHERGGRLIALGRFIAANEKTFTQALARTQPPQQGGDVGEALARLFDCVSTKARGQVTRQNQTDFETIHAYLTQAQEQQTAVIPEGYALVPLKPTEEAITAGMLCDYKTDSARRYLSHQYTAMIAATIKQAEGE